MDLRGGDMSASESCCPRRGGDASSSSLSCRCFLRGTTASESESSLAFLLAGSKSESESCRCFPLIGSTSESESCRCFLLTGSASESESESCRCEAPLLPWVLGEEALFTCQPLPSSLVPKKPSLAASTCRAALSASSAFATTGTPVLHSK